MALISWLSKKVFVIVVIIFLVVFLFQKQLLKLGVIILVKQKSNAGISIGSVESSIQKGLIRLNKVALLNPKGFQEKNLANIDFLLLELDLRKLLSGDIEFKRLFIDIDKVYLVRDAEQGTNLVEVKKESGKTKTRSLSKERKKIAVKDLRIKISEVLYKDFRQEPPKLSRSFLGLEQKYSNVSDLKKLIDSIITQEVLKAAFSNISLNKTGQSSEPSVLDKIINIFN